ncbi:TPA: hypothetical protein DCX66_04125 [Candidatus Nomurabacteria bacterium]|uniref:Uncharacterized protein n=1 Tax=Candidatus Nomurabacteria bacterium GW2011_GWE1_35_16 TaxID=1618761 RepID=A0A0G0B8A0_9BACT|nr:MAG: hypothetical protein UR55_C0019G0002 [Candidatus Nomurabacteria bacterium GW2011_GWF1_34_20]KKP61538.1 MAG: hypothetical protein UR57_C0017G0002 [Candidatus Nomurabacteria bacterium GW2011_GWE2_34_25]KKP65588.1 MAG: hypothetical protein UR64_C0024G0002 [Candidatus Nomurabacteria bacterium GW2011_GWE1_35_16]HAX65626.1 hypothetical protein [Candidatus Nomurabacteria bacterium]HCU01312.1 hypothetical protein [Candidatus Nomurabacteria bacterium]
METKNCQQCKKSFEIESEDFDFYEKIGVPAPTFCPECRLIRRLTFRNDRTLYKRTCEMCNNDVISIYHPGGKTKIVCQKCWWGDDFDASKYGKDYDFSKPFFEQYKELMSEVPFMANFVVDESRMVNSPYNNMVVDLRNCYFLTNADFNEDCAYGSETEKSKNCIDINLVHKSEMCYECVNIQNCYRAFYSIDCESSSDIWFCRDCNGCTDCFGCVNLRKQSFCIFNEPMGSKEAYMEKLKELKLDSRKGIKNIKRKVVEFWKTGITKYMHEKQNDNATGDYIYNSKNIKESWIVYGGWNIKYSQYLIAPTTKDSYDLTQFGDNAELFYEILQGGSGGSNVRFSWFAVNEDRNIDYCIQVMTSHDMFGCIGLRKKGFYILNKEYTEEEYKILREKIIEQMKTMPYKDSQGLSYSYGEFFPSELSPFAYNETTAQEFFPLNERVAKERGYEWYIREQRNYKPTLLVDDIPDVISEVPDTITNEIIECENNGDENKNCATAFKVIPDEFGFYQRFNIPLPSKCPNCRHAERMKLRNGPIFRTGKCAFTGCDKEIITAYSENTPNLYCREHYLQTVV